MVGCEGIEGFGNLLWLGHHGVLFPVPLEVLKAEAGPFPVAWPRDPHHPAAGVAQLVVVGVSGRGPRRSQAHPVRGSDPKGDDTKEGVDGVGDVFTDAAALPGVLQKMKSSLCLRVGSPLTRLTGMWT